MTTTCARNLAIMLAAALLGSCGGKGTGKSVPSTQTNAAGGVTTDSSGGPPVHASATNTRTLTADTTITTPSGATFTAASGWSVKESPDRTILTSPEADVTLGLFELAAADRDAAIAAAWKAWRPGFDLAVARAIDVPDREGWDAVGQVVYVTPEAEQRVVVALARRKGPTWYVTLVEGTIAGADRRGAQLGTAIESFTIPGLEKESFAGRTAHALDAARLAELDAFVAEALAATEVPGASIAIVQDGKVVHAKGYGVRERGKKAAVGPKTLFLIGSVNKSLTTLMQARLVEAGAFAWETPVIDVLPSFALGDEATTRAVTMRHTACACTGLPRQDLEMIFETAVTPEQSLATLGTMKPTTGFGETFQYSNLLVSAGGYAGAHAHAKTKKLGPAYDAAMKALVFAPLGMKSTTFDFKTAAKADHATPHPTDLHGKPAPVALSDENFVIPVRPAGGAWSNVVDMARVALLELGNGKLDGKQVIGEAALLARRQPQVKINDNLSYGLGLVVGTDKGLAVVTHSGGTIGFVSELMLWPEHGVGLVILTNSAGGGLFTSVVSRRLVEILFDAKAEARDRLATSLAQRNESIAENWKQIEATPDPAWFAELTGVWTAPGLGRIELRVDKGKAVLDAGEWQVAVGKKTGRDGTVMLVSTSAPLAGLELVPKPRDGKTVLVLADSQKEYVFERVAPTK